MLPTKGDSLGDRMKNYEYAFTSKLINKNSYVCARIDGRAFSKLTKGAERPFDKTFTEAIKHTAKQLTKEFHADVAYCQSDEITLVWFPKQDEFTEFIFSGKIQKLTSTLASKASSLFIIYMIKSMHAWWQKRVIETAPSFDCRIFELPTKMEYINAVFWRMKDNERNWVNQWCRSFMSHKSMIGIDRQTLLSMAISRGRDPSEVPDANKYGTLFVKEEQSFFNKENVEYFRQVIISLNVSPQVFHTTFQ